MTTAPLQYAVPRPTLTMTIHNNNVNHCTNNIDPLPQPQSAPAEYANPNFTSSEPVKSVERQELSSVIERESTAPCVTPEESDPEPDPDKNQDFEPDVKFPFIDSDSMSSLVGRDDLHRRNWSTIRQKKKEADDSQDEKDRPASHSKTVTPVEIPVHGTGSPQPNTPPDKPTEEVIVPLIAVSRVESVKTTESRVRRLLSAVRSRSVRRNKEHGYKSRSENRARKALRTITVILGTFTILWTPFYVLATVYGFCASCQSNKIFNLFYSISYYLCYMNSPINPFCYAMANQQFKRTLTRIFKGDFHRV